MYVVSMYPSIYRYAYIDLQVMLTTMFILNTEIVNLTL